MIVAETGGDIARFPTPERLTAWAGLAPGNRESAGKRRRAGKRKGNEHLKAAMVEAAWSTGRTWSRIGARLRRLVRRFGRQHAKKGRRRRRPLPDPHRLGGHGPRRGLPRRL
ncbi:transposase [Nonomuraea sp. NPDC050153]|uniref:transposase n=1 Tax=Nonomuraea sp. NPDC050153 TaxID=3364359 RepID=UPI00379CB80B